MCGYLGIFASRVEPLGEKEISWFRAQSQKLAHRGNTSAGEKTAPHQAFFHHRLAFRDLDQGLQPLTDSKNRATIIFNGELYDFRALREKLAPRFDFRTRSDTEVILAAYLEWGDELLSHFDGEYSFVIYDHRDNSLVAARDSFGVKPLFWAASGGPIPGLDSFLQRYSFAAPGRLHLASEIKGLGIPLRWNQRGLNRLQMSLYEEMGTSFEGVYQLPPGTLLRATQNEKGFLCTMQRHHFPCRRRGERTKLSFEKSAEELQKIIRRTVVNKLDSDVPLGAYLSGGVDSRIAAFEMGRLKDKIQTFTVGFEGKDYDETPEVKKFLSAYPNLEGNFLRLKNSALEYSYPHAVYASELVQPYTNGSAKWWLSLFARQKVRGVLTGDGADEVFCGYPSFRYLAWWQFYQRHPSLSRRKIFDTRVRGKSKKFWEMGLSSQSDGSDLEASFQALGWHHPLFAQIQSLGTQWLGQEKRDTFLASEREKILSYLPPVELSSPLMRWQSYFLRTHFPTHVLNWVGDRMEMANTLEGRPIFLSKEIQDFLNHLPDSYLVRGLKDKAVLRKAYEKELQGFSRSPKKQFNAPFLFKGKLGKEFLSPKALKAAGLIDPVLVARAKRKLLFSKPGLERSFTQIFLQNCLVTQMLDRYLVRGQAPEREAAFEQKYLERNSS